MSASSTLELAANIMVVDDTPANLRLLSQILSERSYKVRAVLSGSQAIVAAQAAPPDLILLDIRMPEMNGYEVCAQLKADERMRDTPVLFISALDETEDKVKAFAVGGVDYIPKPFQAAEVLARVQTHLALRDLNRRLQAANAQLAQHVVELEARDEELDAFAHTVAHDIRNPVAQMVGTVQILVESDTELPPVDRDKSLHLLLRTGEKLTNIIDELLLLAGLRHVEVQLEPLNMAAIVNEALTRLRHVLDQAQAEVTLPDAESWPTVHGHPAWVEEVWVNYISNACKYGRVDDRPPRITLGADPTGFENSSGRMMFRFWARDFGIGTASDDQSRLFTPFTRLDQVRIRGHGLGLSIVRRIVEKLGGDVSVKSDGMPGHGSEFSFTLPAARIE
jgi:two-component system, sensor histidine kinase and response regulator